MQNYFSILLSNKRKTLKIADFGTVREMQNDLLRKNVGTIIYTAPEVFCNSNYTTKCDVYSFGITLCEMFTRQRPYSLEIRAEIDRDPSHFIDRISQIDSPLRPTLNSEMPQTISLMITQYAIVCFETKGESTLGVGTRKQIFDRL